MNPTQDSTDAEIDAFVQVCERLAGFDERPEPLSPEWADGFLTAVAAGPRALAEEEWLPALCDEAFERCFADPDDAAQAMQTLRGRLKVLRAQLEPERLLDHPDDMFLRPLVYVWDDAAREQAAQEGSLTTEQAQQLQTGTEWGLGFLAAVAAFPADWETPLSPEAAEELDDLLQHLMVLAWPPGSDPFLAHLARFHARETPDRDALFDTACFVVQDLRVWWLDHASKPATRRVEAAPGRNDPCPCGSGRKYKKCCGAAAG